MILHDRVDVWTRPGGVRQPWGKTAGVPAEVLPLDSSGVLSDNRSLTVISRYRVVLKAVFVLPPAATTNFKISWGAFVITDPSLSGPGLMVDGTVERHHLRGRLHHYEFISKSVSSA